MVPGIASEVAPPPHLTTPQRISAASRHMPDSYFVLQRFGARTRLAGSDTSCDPQPMSPRLPDPDLVRAFARAVRAHFEEEVAKDREQAEARRTTVLPGVRSAIERARAEGMCDEVWLFGSYAWGEPGARSDVDLLVDGCADPFVVASLVGRACGLDVHVIDMSDAPASLKERVRKDGVPL